SGALNYYRNTGTNTAPVWALETESLGGIAAGERARLQLLVADFDQDTRPDLLTSNLSGQLRLYPNFLAHLAGSFPAEENILWQHTAQQFGPALLGTGTTMAAADVDQDGKRLPEVFIGTHAGGFRFLKVLTDPLSAEDEVLAAEVRLYPNPAQKFTQLLTPKDASFTLHNVSGQLLLQGKTAARKAYQISTATLPAGLYLLRVVLADGDAGTYKLIVRQ
ncbi:MAG: T9SS type A sorting domain-containing protein, partial [Rufibacter sp.]